MTARERLAVERLVARHLDLQQVGECVHHRDADAVQAARGLVDLRVELTAGVQRGHDDLERRLAGEFRVRVDRDAAAVVGDDEGAGLLKLHLDEAGMAGDRLVHRVVDHLGEQVVERPLVGAADIHAGPAPDGLQPLQHLDVGGGVAALRLGGRERRHGGRRIQPPPRLGRAGRRALAARPEQVPRRIAHARPPGARRVGRLGFAQTGLGTGLGSWSMRLHPRMIAEQTINIKAVRPAARRSHHRMLRRRERGPRPCRHTVPRAGPSSRRCTTMG